MAVTYGFFNSMSGDRKYSAEQFGSIFDGVIKDGIYQAIGQHFAVAPGTGLQVLVRSGRAWFNHTWTYNDADYPLAIAAADKSLKRLDLVILEIDARNEVRKNSFKIVKGTPASTPSEPGLTNNSTVHQYKLACVTVNANATRIESADIKNYVGQGSTPFVTSVLATTDITSLMSDFRGQFDKWFNNVKAQLEGNIATNLQNQINTNKTNITNLTTTVTNNYNTLNGKFASYLPTASKASAAEVTTGTVDTKYTTPKSLRAEFNKYLLASNKATAAEAQAGTNNVKYITPSTLKSGVSLSGRETVFTATYSINGTSVSNSITIPKSDNIYFMQLTFTNFKFSVDYFQIIVSNQSIFCPGRNFTNGSTFNGKLILLLAPHPSTKMAIYAIVNDSSWSMYARPALISTGPTTITLNNSSYGGNMSGSVNVSIIKIL